MKANVIREECIGCGLCESISPVFKLDDENIATVVEDPISPENMESAIEAKDSCPTSAIEIFE